MRVKRSKLSAAYACSNGFLRDGRGILVRAWCATHGMSDRDDADDRMEHRARPHRVKRCVNVSNRHHDKSHFLTIGRVLHKRSDLHGVARSRGSVSQHDWIPPIKLSDIVLVNSEIQACDGFGLRSDSG